MTGLPAETFERIGGGTSAAGGTATLTHPTPQFVQWVTGRDPGEGGPVVNQWTALNYAALYTCVTLIAGTVAALPCKVYRRRADGGQDEATDHPAAELLAREFNPNTSAMTGRQTEVGHLLTWGNSYQQVVRSRAGDLLRLQPLGPDLVDVDTDRSGDLEYTVTERGGAKEYRLGRDEVVHVPDFSFDALVGLSRVLLARGTIRGGMAQDRMAEKFTTKGLRAPGAIQFPEGRKFKTAAEKVRFREGWRAVHGGDSDGTDAVILEDGAKWQSLGVDPDKAQLLESRKFARGEIAGLYHIPPHLIGDVEKNTSWGTGIEELNIGFVVYCLQPILRAIEQERNRKLFVRGRKADAGLFVEHNLNGLLRGDSGKRSQFYKEMMERGVMSVNEVRKLEGLNPRTGGDVWYFPLNMGRVDKDGNDVPPPAPAEPPAPDPAPATAAHHRHPADAAVAAALLPVVAGAVARCLRKEAAAAAAAAGRPAGFLAWMDDFYARHAAMVADACGPPLAAVAALRPAAAGLAAGYPARHVERSRADLLAAAECPPADLAARVERVVQGWQVGRPAELAAELGGYADATA